MLNTIGRIYRNIKLSNNGNLLCDLIRHECEIKLPVALQNENNALVSPAYTVFEIIDQMN